MVDPVCGPEVEKATAKYTLELTDAQRSPVTASFERVHSEAVRLGEAVVDVEPPLDRRFASRHLDEAALAQRSSDIGVREGELRFVHLWAHLETAAALSAGQRARNLELRGYAAAGEHGELHRGHEKAWSMPAHGTP